MRKHTLLAACASILLTRTGTSLAHQDDSALVARKSGNASALTVDLGYASYQGSFDISTNISTFLGVRYAAAPTDDLRWRAPQAPEKVAGIQQATAQPPACYQSTVGNATTNPFLSHASQKRQTTTDTEDCLFLNVYVPGAGPWPSHRPVLVWIHGGGYVLGGASQYNGADLVADSDNSTIIVIIQYRLGLFGFLAGEEVKSKGALNAGLLDQNFALQWVQQHIEKFGGDKSKVTIWGESAGAGSVLQHVVAHGGQTHPPLFRAAITSSTFLPSQYSYRDKIPATVYQGVLTATNCSSAHDTLACLRATDINVLQRANVDISLEGFIGTFVWIPVVDGSFIIERPTVTLNRKRVNGDVLLAVTNTFEGRFFTATTTTNTTEYVRQLFPELNHDQIDKASSYYTALNATLPTALDQAIAIMGETIFICPSYYLLQAFEGHAYKAAFAIPPADHGFDIPYYFTSSTSVTTRSFDNADFIKAFSQSFFSVIKSENPNAKFDATNITPLWNRWGANHTEMVFNETVAQTPNVTEITTDPGLLARCAFWNSVGQGIGQ